MGFLKFVLFLLIGIGVVGAVGYQGSGWTGAALGDIMGAVAAMYGTWKVLREHRKR